MATKIVVPELGESIVEATVGNWLKQQGDRVAAGEAVVELETDKVDLEVGAEQDGVLARIERQTGQDVKIGDVLGVIEEVPVEHEASTADHRPQTAERKAAEKETETESEAPKEKSPSVSQTPVVLKDDGKQASPDIEPKGVADQEKVTPVARRLAHEYGVNLAQVAGTGQGGRVTKEDVERFIEGKKPEAPPPVAPLPVTRAVPPVTRDLSPLPEERVRMSRRRRTIAQRLVEAQRTAAILTTFNEMDMSAVMALRARRKESFKERHGVGLGIVSFFVKASIGALKDFPRMNAEIQGEEMVLKHYYDIGIAIGDEEGLVVPVLRAADRMSFAEIEKTIKDFVAKGEQSALTVDDLRGGTFTISNGGVYGSLLSTPILNPPQAGILGLHKIEDRPIALNGEVVIRPMMYVALSYDHRIVDGREAVQFLVRIKELVEDPEAMLLEG